MGEVHAPIDGPTLLGYVEEVADLLADDGAKRRLVVVGGALLAWYGLRDATRDVDSVERLDEALRTAAETVAARHDLSPGWINDSASQFLPAGFDLAGATILLDHPRLLVVGPAVDHVFVMKLFAGRAVDTDDLRQLWSHTSFETSTQAVAAFEAAYPHEDPDPHLAEWLNSVIGH
ncbi:MAG: hypothetical protein GY708_24575 [Actinomycetia bacterium]|nr:hypothetical protein [Actinomycetes bacterium]MCP4962276.1 hypothetical protein [Actinomycetes bacterium]